ncbi:MAG: outer membrane beta-barrel protein [Alphaproteobacteria bacterium]|nr:outer membrane beta-barrel protein [Alphaproteobacteria bacterium]
MKKIAVSALAVVLACPAFAGQSSDSSFTIMGLDPYIGMRLGMGYNNLQYSLNDKKESVEDVDFRGRLALGLDICDTVRSEIEWSLFTKTKDTKDFGDLKNVKIESKLQTLMWNSYWEIGGYHMIRPFIGAGIGLAFTDVSRNSDVIKHESDKATRFTAMGTVGMTFDWQIFAVDVSARYNYIDVRSGMHDIGADVGVRFMF